MSTDKFKEREAASFHSVKEFQNSYLAGLLKASKSIINPKIESVAQSLLTFMKSEERLLEQSVKTEFFDNLRFVEKFVDLDAMKKLLPPDLLQDTSSNTSQTKNNNITQSSAKENRHRKQSKTRTS